MPMIDLDVEYFPLDPMESLAIFLKSAGDEEIHGKVFRKVGQEIVEDARKNIIDNGSYQTGRLYNSVYAHIKNDDTLEVGADTPYASHVEYGFIHHKSKAFVEGKPYLQPAIKKNASKIQRELGSEIQESYMKKINGIGGAALAGDFSSKYKSFGLKSVSTKNVGKFGGWQSGSTYRGI